jgi:transcriptional regulator with XRE-family HTH domain
MEFNQKLQELRKTKGLTQAELADALYVSRTAISKWESGKGYPSIDSLKSIAKYFSVTVDELLSGDEVLIIAEHDSKQKENRLRDLLFGLVDTSVALLFFLPLFAARADGTVESASLLTFVGAPYLEVAYYAVVIALVLTGILTLALQNIRAAVWAKSKAVISLSLGAASVLLFVLSLQPYAAAFAFALLLIKVIFLIKLT